MTKPVALYKVWHGWQVVQTPYPGRYAGIFTEGKYGTLDCGSGKNASKKNRKFYHFIEDAQLDGLDACGNCKPLDRPIASKKDCNHLPFGDIGFPSVVVRKVGRALKVICDLCGVKAGDARPNTARRNPILTLDFITPLKTRLPDLSETRNPYLKLETVDSKDCTHLPFGTEHAGPAVVLKNKVKDTYDALCRLCNHKLGTAKHVSDVLQWQIKLPDVQGFRNLINNVKP